MPRFPHAITALAIAAVALLSSPVLGQDAGYLENGELSDRLHALAESDPRAVVSKLGESLEGAPIELVTLTGDAELAGEMPALLITAGLDGRQLAGTETALRIAEQILREHPGVLDSMTVYIIPRVNPDGAAMNLRPVTMGYSGNARPVDEDRDRMTDEDGPEDLNGDGYITMMRRLDPPLSDPPTHLADPDDERLSIAPETDEGQRASFTLYPEGLDNDQDGLINEDGPGGVDLDRNFMHAWPEHEARSGRHQLSEPETYALARFVLDHGNIVMAVTLGRHDNLVNQPDAKAKDISGRAPKEIDADDAGMYKRVGEWFTEATGMKEAGKENTDGSFHAWLYAQRGIPSFAVNPWARPGPEKEADKDTDDGRDDDRAGSGSEPVESGPALTPSPIGDISQETLDELAAAYEAQTGEPVDQSMMSMVTPEMVVQFAAQAGIEVRRVKPEATDGKAEAGEAKKGKKKQSEDAKWLAYFEESGIDGFIGWTGFEHPTLGRVEIGGFKPLARINPPAEDLDTLAEKHTEFVLKLIEARPSVRVAGPEVERLGEGVYEVRLAIINDGRLPTTTAYSRTARSMRPMVIRLSAGVDRIISGQRVDRVWGIDADGGRSEHRWIFRSDDLSQETIEIVDPRLGDRIIMLAEPEETHSDTGSEQ
ncbi:MAG: M14 family metallopeptidase [Phycisphaerales bacterium]